MRKLLFFLTLAICLFACNPAPPYQYIQSPTGQQMVVVRDDDGTEFLMEYMLFTSLMNSGGYNNVMYHYHTNVGSYTRYNRSAYSNWGSFRGRSYNPTQYNNYNSPSNFRSSSTSRPPVFKNTSPSNNPATFRNTSPSSNTGSFRNTSPSGSSRKSWFSSPKSSGSSGFRSSSSSSGFRSSSSSYRSSSSSGFRSRKN